MRSFAIFFNVAISCLLGATGMVLVVYTEISLSSLGYPGFAFLLMPIPVLIFSDGIILFAIRKSSKTLFNYYIATRLLLMAILTFIAYRDVSDGVGLDTDYFPLIAIACTTLFTITTFLLRPYNTLQIRMRNAFLLVSMIIMAVNIFFATIGVGIVKNGWSAKKKDAQISYDFHLMSQDINRISSYGDKALPYGTAKELAQQGEYGKEFHIGDRADAYTYKILDDGSFELCATFETDTTTDPLYQNRSYIREDDENYHRAGYQCIHYDNP